MNVKERIKEVNDLLAQAIKILGPDDNELTKAFTPTRLLIYRARQQLSADKEKFINPDENKLDTFDVAIIALLIVTVIALCAIVFHWTQDLLIKLLEYLILLITRQ